MDAAASPTDRRACRFGYACVISALWLLSTAAYGQAVKAAGLPVLTEVSQIRQLTPAQVSRGYAVHITAVVTYYWPSGPNFLGRDTYMSSDTPDLFVQDATAGIWVNVPKGAPPLQVGQLIDLAGVTEIPDFAPQIGKPVYHVIGKAPLPQPQRPPLERMLSTAEDSQWVETTGIVRRVRVQDDLLTLEIAVAGGRLRAVVPGIYEADPSKFVDAEVRIRGACGAVFNRKLQLTGILLYVPGLDKIDILRPPQDPFDKDIHPLEMVSRFASESTLGHRIRVQGVVTLAEPGRTLYLSDGRTGLRVETAEPGSFRLETVWTWPVFHGCLTMPLRLRMQCAGESNTRPDWCPYR